MAASPIFIEATDEIPGVIERIRETPHDEVRLVLAPRSRFAQSRFNFQLLRQYATRLGKRVAIVAPDAAVQRLAEETGFATEVVGPRAGFPVPQVRPAAAPVELEAAPKRPAEPIAPGRVGSTQRDSVGPIAASPPSEPRPPLLQPVLRAGAGPGPPPGPLASLGRVYPGVPRIRVGVPGRLLPGTLGAGVQAPQLVLYVGALVILLAGIMAAAIYVPSAKVTLVADAKPFASELDVNTEPNKPPIRVRSVQVSSKPLSRSFKATGVKADNGQVARGRFTYANECPSPLQISNGQRLRTAGGVQFAQLGDVLLRSNGNATVDILATQPGQAGNVGAGQITVIENNPFDSCLKGVNREPTNGGVDEQKKTVIQGSDIQAARAQLEQSLAQQLTDDVSKQVKPGEKLNEPLNLNAPDFKTTHNVGDEIASFTATMTLKAEASFFYVADVDKAFADVLKSKVPADQQLTTNKVEVDYQVTPLGGGRLNFRGRASGFVAPKIDLGGLTARLAGKSPAAAAAEASRLPVRSVDIEQYPFPLPLMPLSGSRINVRYEIDTKKGPELKPG